MTEENDLRSTLEAAFAGDDGRIKSGHDDAKDAGDGHDDAKDVIPGLDPGIAATGERSRDEHGRFVPKAAEPASPVTPAEAGVPLTIRDEAAKLDSGLRRNDGEEAKTSPPPGWSIKSKADFDALPAHVRDDIAKRETEISNGFAKLTQYKGLDPWVDMARSAGKTLPEVVAAYVKAEEMLGQDFGKGVKELCRMYNVDPAKLGQMLAGDDPRIKSGDDDKNKDVIAPVLDRIASVDQRLAQWERQMAERETEQVAGELTRFAADPAHKFFENVRQTMGQIMAVNPQASLSEAYDQACWMNPEIRPLRIKEQHGAEAAKSRAAADQARRAAGSLPTGSPVPGAMPGSGPASTLRAELERAFEAARI
jgi:hypothetical protein